MIAFFMIFVAMGRLYRNMFKQPEARALLLTALLVVGEVVRLRERLSWFDTLPHLAERGP